ncbi:MAG: hypothetical protein JWP52_4453 [Rhizobacter sp.]|nr:hypothetical protein [Rhizobacter sp.]
MSGRQRLAASVAVIVLLAIACAAALAWHPAIAPVSAPARSTFDTGLVKRGAQLAAAGNCIGCHAVDENSAFSGGRAIPTPFGTIHSTNITPDPQTGIGQWSQAAFERALREGVSRDGHMLYPAFPYDHFTRLHDDDVKALYAFFMTRDPVVAQTPPNDLMFPLGFRPLVAGWNLLFLNKQPAAADPAQNAEWNRGAYLADALAHCSACHSPRNALGAEVAKQRFDGGQAEGWYAPAINAHSPSPQPWTVDALTAYLRTGIAADHAIAGGPMQGVVAGLAKADERDVRALAVYVQSLMGAPTAEQQARAKASMDRAQGPLAMARAASAGAGASATAIETPASATLANTAKAATDSATLTLGGAVYAATCASCHDVGRTVSSNGALRLPLAVAVYEPDPSSLIRIIRDGIHPLPLEAGRLMPGFAGTLTDEQVTALLAYLRHQAADLPPWPDAATFVQKAKSP